MDLEPIVQKLIADSSGWTKGYAEAERAVDRFGGVVNDIGKQMSSLQTLMSRGISVGISQEQIGQVQNLVDVLKALRDGIQATNNIRLKVDTGQAGSPPNWMTAAMGRGSNNALASQFMVGGMSSAGTADASYRKLAEAMDLVSGRATRGAGQKEMGDAFRGVTTAITEEMNALMGVARAMYEAEQKARGLQIAKKALGSEASAQRSEQIQSGLTFRNQVEAARRSVYEFASPEEMMRMGYPDPRSGLKTAQSYEFSRTYNALAARRARQFYQGVLGQYDRVTASDAGFGIAAGDTDKMRRMLGEGGDGGEGVAGGVTRGLHPYYLMHQFHNLAVEVGNAVTYGIQRGLSGVTDIVADGVRSGFQGIGQEASKVLRAATGVGGAFGQGIGGLGGALAGGVQGYGRALGSGIGGMYGAGVSAVGSGVAAGSIFGPVAGGVVLGTGLANVGLEAYKMRVDMGVNALATSFNLVSAAAQTFLGTVSELTERMAGLGMQMERDRVSLTALAGDKGLGQQLFGSLQDLSLEQPLYSFKELAEQARVLAAQGIPIGSLIPTLRTLGDVAMGDEATFHRAALAFGDIWAEGGVTSRRIRQLASIGVGKQDIATTMGLDLPEFNAKLRAGEVTVNDLIRTFNRLTSEQGRFFGQSKEQLDTVSGQWSKLQRVIDRVLGETALQGFERYGVKGGIGGLADTIWGNKDQIGEGILAVFDRVRAAIQGIVDYVKSAWGGVLDTFGMTGKTLEDILPSVERVRSFFRDATSEIVGWLLKMSQAILGMVGQVDVVPTGAAGHFLGYDKDVIQKQMADAYHRYGIGKEYTYYGEHLGAFSKGMGELSPEKQKALQEELRLIQGGTGLGGVAGPLNQMRLMVQQFAEGMVRAAKTMEGVVASPVIASTTSPAGASPKALANFARGKGLFPIVGGRRFSEKAFAEDWNDLMMDVQEPEKRLGDLYKFFVKAGVNPVTSFTGPDVATLGTGLLVRGVNALPGLLYGGLRGAGIPLMPPNKLTKQEQDYYDQLEKMVSEQKGKKPFIDQFDVFRHQRDLYRGLEEKGKLAAPDLRRQADIELFKSYEDLQKSTAHLRLTEHMPKIMFAGSAEAQDVINRSTMQPHDPIEEVKMTLDLANEIHRDHSNYLAQILDAIRNGGTGGLGRGGPGPQQPMPVAKDLD